MEQWMFDLQDGYNRVAEEYANTFIHELDYKPLDRDLLGRLIALCSGKGQICDLGCGPGQIARYLSDHGAQVMGVDYAPDMVEKARQINPDIHFQQGNMLALELPNNLLAGIAAFYSLIHIPRPQMDQALKELFRVLQPGGWLLASYHIGSEVVHPDEFLGKKVSIDWFFYLREEMTGFIKNAGFEVVDDIERAPYPTEHPSRRGYIFARKPEA